MPLPGEDKMYITKKTMEQEIVSFLGGRAAEQIIFKDVTTGASNDIERATGIARSMVMKYGMSDVLGPVLFGDDGGEVFIGKEIAHSRNYGEDVAGTIDKEVKRIMDTSYNEAIRLLNENIDVLHATAKILVEKEKITGEDFRKIMENPTEALEEIEASEKVGLEKNSGENDEVSNETENKKAIDIVIEDSKEETKNENCEKTEE